MHHLAGRAERYRRELRWLSHRRDLTRSRAICDSGRDAHGHTDTNTRAHAFANSDTNLGANSESDTNPDRDASSGR